MGTGVSLEVHRSASLAYTAANNKKVPILKKVEGKDGHLRSSLWLLYMCCDSCILVYTYMRAYTHPYNTTYVHIQGQMEAEWRWYMHTWSLEWHSLASRTSYLREGSGLSRSGHSYSQGLIPISLPSFVYSKVLTASSLLGSSTIINNENSIPFSDWLQKPFS